MTPYIGEERYYLFDCSEYYPSGGAKDFVRHGTSIEELMAFRDANPNGDDAHICDADMKIVAYWDRDGWHRETPNLGIPCTGEPRPSRRPTCYACRDQRWFPQMNGRAIPCPDCNREGKFFAFVG